MPGLNGKYTAIIEYYFLVVSFRKCFLNEIKNTSNRVSYLQTIEPYTGILFLIWQTGWVESASSDSGGTQQYLVKTDMIIVEVFQFISSTEYFTVSNWKKVIQSNVHI